MHRDRNVYAMRRHLAICVNSISFYSLTNIFRQLSVCVCDAILCCHWAHEMWAHILCVCVCVWASSLCISNSRKFPKANPEKLLQVKIKCDRIRVKVRAVCKCFLISYPRFPPPNYFPASDSKLPSLLISSFFPAPTPPLPPCLTKLMPMICARVFDSFWSFDTPP